MMMDGRGNIFLGLVVRLRSEGSGMLAAAPYLFCSRQDIKANCEKKP
jgi:hypothetical protein